MHRVDSLELVQDMILDGLGVGLLPAGRPVRRGVVLRTLGQPAVTQRPFAVTRRGRSAWPPLALVLQLLGEISGLTARRINDELRVSPARWQGRSWYAVMRAQTVLPPEGVALVPHWVLIASTSISPRPLSASAPTSARTGA